MKYVPIKFAQADLQKCITWLKKFGKGTKHVLRLAFTKEN